MSTSPTADAPPDRFHVQLLYGNGGGGHKASALAVQRCLLDSPSAHLLDVHLVDASSIAGGNFGDSLYNLLLSYNLITAIELAHSALQSIIFPLIRPTLRSAFRTHFAATLAPRACIVSFIPMLNAVIADALPPNVPLLTVFTDFSHTAGHPWIQHPRQHLVTGTDTATQQALRAGYTPKPLPPSTVISPAAPYHNALQQPPSPTHTSVASTSMFVTPTSGMVVHPKFYASLPAAMRKRRRADLGLPPDLPTALVCFGGSPPTDRVSRLVHLLLAAADPHQFNVIVICAKNRQLFDRLTRLKRRSLERRLFITGFTDDVPLFMQLADVVIGKPGPGVVSEALVSGTPSVLVTGAAENQVMKQERDVLDWVRRYGIGRVARDEDDAVRNLAADLQPLRDNIRKLPTNRAVFEVSDLVLDQLGVLDHDYLNFDSGSDHLVSSASLISHGSQDKSSSTSSSDENETETETETENDDIPKVVDDDDFGVGSESGSSSKSTSFGGILSSHLPASLKDGLSNLLSAQSLRLDLRRATSPLEEQGSPSTGFK